MFKIIVNLGVSLSSFFHVPPVSCEIWKTIPEIRFWLSVFFSTTNHMLPVLGTVANAMDISGPLALPLGDTLVGPPVEVTPKASPAPGQSSLTQLCKEGTANHLHISHQSLITKCLPNSASLSWTLKVLRATPLPPNIMGSMIKGTSVETPPALTGFAAKISELLKCQKHMTMCRPCQSLCLGLGRGTCDEIPEASTSSASGSATSRLRQEQMLLFIEFKGKRDGQGL